MIGLVLTTGAGLIGLGSEERELETKPAKAGVLSEVEDEDEDEDEEALRYLWNAPPSPEWRWEEKVMLALELHLDGTLLE